MSLNRRAVLKFGVASAVILFAAGAALTFKDTSLVREPWNIAPNRFDDARLNALAYAILAPNPHNRQPWLIELSEDPNMFTLYCDLDRLLPETDPPNRQVTIGLGAFLELFKMAAASQGFATDITPFPEGEPYPVLDERPIAHVRINSDPTVKPHPLFGQVLERRTNRFNFDDERPVTSEVLENLKTLSGLKPLGVTNSSYDVEALKTLCVKAWQIETHTPHTHAESVRLTRVGANAVKANPDGISLYGPFMEAMRLSGAMSAEAMNDKSSQAFAGTVKFYSDLINSAQAFAWLTSAGNSRLDQLNAGRDWLHINLVANDLGLAFHPLSQALQEFPEMEEVYADIHDYLGIQTPARIQGLFRLGYAKQAVAAPRWPLETRLA